MGTWGTGIFHDDVACDVRRDFLDCLASGVGIAVATREVVAEWIGDAPDMDEEPVVWLALAATQWEYGCLLPEVKARSLQVIDNEQDLERWAGSSTLGRRKYALARLRRKILSPQPPKRMPRTTREPEIVETDSVPSPNGTAFARVWEPGNASGQSEQCAQVLLELEVKGQRGGGNVVVAQCRAADVGLAWSDRETLTITLPAGTKTQQKEDEIFFYGRTIRVNYIET